MDAVVDFGSGRAGNRYRHRRVLRGEEEEDGKGQIIANAKKIPGLHLREARNKEVAIGPS